MAQENSISENARESQFAEHKGSGFAVPSPQWYIAECKPTRERTIRDMLKKAGYEAYVASQKERHRYKSGNIRVVEHVILPGKIFVHTHQASLAAIMSTFTAVYRFQLNRAASIGKLGMKPFAFVPSADMQRMMDFLDKASKPVFITAGMLRLDQPVKVVNGPLAGFEGRFYREGAATYIVIKVELGTNHYAYTEVSVDDIAVVDTK